MTELVAAVLPPGNRQVLTTLASGATSGALTISTAAAVPLARLELAGQFRILVGKLNVSTGAVENGEYMIVTGGQITTTWTVSRGAEGSTAVSHASGESIFHVLTPGSLSALAAELATSNETYAAEVLGEPSLVSYWKLNDTGGTAVDQKGTNNGVYNGGVIPCPGPLRAAGDFTPASTMENTSSYVSVANSASLELTEESTVEAWVKVIAETTEKGIVCRPGFNLDVNFNVLAFRTSAAVVTGAEVKTNKTTTLEKVAKATCEQIKVGMQAAAPNHLYSGSRVVEVKPAEEKVILNQAAGDSTINVIVSFLSESRASLELSPGVWHHIAGVSKKTAGVYTTEIYIDGGLWHSDYACAPENTKAAIFIGRQAGGNTLGGSIGHVAIYKAALTAERIRNHYEAGIAPPRPASNSKYQKLILSHEPIAYWRLNEPRGSTIARDLAGIAPGEYGIRGSGKTLLREPPLINGDPSAASVYFKGTGTVGSANGGFVTISNANYLKEKLTTAGTWECWAEVVEDVGAGSTGYSQLWAHAEESSGFVGWGVQLANPLIPSVGEAEANRGKLTLLILAAVGANSGSLVYTNEAWLTKGVRRHLAFVFDGSKKEMLIYVDGVSRTVTNNGVAAVPNEFKWKGDPTNPLSEPWPPAAIGSEGEWKPGDSGINARMAEVAIYNKVLTAAQIKEHYEAGK